VAGDYYDFFPLPGPRLGTVIADVSDKGMPAALFMAMTRSTLRASAGQCASPAEGIALANQLICADASEGMFVTLFYAQLDLASGEMVYVNAGHNPPLLLRADAERPTPLTRTGMALGVVAETSFEQRVERLDPRDLVFLYTDGITEATDAREREFGLQRLQALLVRERDAPATGLVEAIVREVGEHVGDREPLDDVTMVAVRRQQEPV
jgi:sigma-B regulation protein RsbU (phosphoserine phosphatase)